MMGFKMADQIASNLVALQVFSKVWICADNKTYLVAFDTTLTTIK